jgi:dihydrofolate reductase
MRTVIYGAACSLDGFIAGPNGEIDWLQFSADVRAYMEGFWPRIDTMIMGRKTYEVSLSQGGGGMPGIKKAYVFSRTLTSVKKSFELVTTDAAEFIRELKNQEGKDICVWGGGVFARSLLDAGVVDEIGLNIHPILLGAGIPMFGAGGTRVPLSLGENKTIAGGCILATYTMSSIKAPPLKRTRRSTTSRS